MGTEHHPALAKNTLVKHVKRGTFYQIVADGQYKLLEFSAEGSLHKFWDGDIEVDCELQFSGEGVYAGPIVIYKGTDEKYWIRPRFEFFDGRFTVEEGILT